MIMGWWELAQAQFFVEKYTAHWKEQDRESSPGCCGSVDGVPARGPNGCRLDSQSGHRPGLQARSVVGGVREAATH